MKETIETIPVTDAFQSGDECPFCHLERMAEQRTIRYVLGPAASYMEPDVRGATDRAGFCGAHYKKLYDFGNALGNALMLQTYYAGLLEEWEEVTREFSVPEKPSLFGKKREKQNNSIVDWAKKRQNSCYICQRLESNMNRYYETFFALIKKPEFRELVESGKGFCMRHFARLMESAETELPNSQREWFYPTVLNQMGENLARVKEDIDWFVGKFDYRQAGADWKNSKDAVSRGMQKLKGLYPADKPYKLDP